MSANDLLALDAVLRESHNERAPDLDDSDYFELFAAEQVLKDYQLTDDEIESGLVGGFDEGGIDAIYFLVNRQLVTEDTEIDAKEVTKASLILVQATRQRKFNQIRVDKLALLTEDLLNLSLGIKKLAGTYNPEVLEAISTFKDQYKGFIHTPHEFTITYYYVAKSETRTINNALKRAAKRARDKAHELFSDAECSFEFLGAAELLSLIRQRPRRSFRLPTSEMPLALKGQEAYVCLVPISEYYQFITDDRGDQREPLYESNVRHWQGENRVNSEIKATLEEQTADEDFWWLNNGITILCSTARIAGGHLLSIEDPQVVNGAQTSRAIFNYFKARGGVEGEDRNVLIRVIKPSESESQARIIRATNSQTQMPDYQLHSTEKIHRDIETYLRRHGLFYDRQRRFYKNQGKPISKIVEQLFLAQAVIAIVLQQPNDARGRPSSVLKREYDRVFTERYPLSLYANCALVAKRVDAFLRSSVSGVERRDRVNLRWYVAMEYARALANVKQPTPQQISEVDIPTDGNSLMESYEHVRAEYDRLGGTDLAAKGPELIATIKGEG